MVNTPKICYQNPPIREAVCEIVFADRSFGKEHLERMQTLWQERYPHQQIVKGEQLQLQISLARADVEKSSLGLRLICRAADNARVVQLGPKSLIINQVKPYPGRKEGFCPAILERFSEVGETLGAAAVESVALRYINIFDFPERHFSWDRWFVAQLPIPAPLNKGLTAFQVQFHDVLDEALSAKINIQRVQPSPSNTQGCSVVLDTEINGKIGANELRLPDRLEQVHNAHVSLFESYIKDATRELLDPTPNAGHVDV